MPLVLQLGSGSEPGPRERNEDYFGAVTPEGEARALKGAVFAVADGVGGGNGGREAAENTVRSVLSDYYATPDTWEIPHAIDTVAGAVNRWLRAQSAAHRELAGMACTLSLLVLRGTRYTLAHVGDTRVYRLRGETLEQLTTDHVWDRPDMQHVLKRAVGLDEHLVLDFSEGELRAGDTFLLASDGVWEPLGQKRLHELLRLHENPQRAAEALVRAALDQGGQDNATALIIRVDELPREELSDILARQRELAVPPPLKAGQEIDDFEVLEQIHGSRATVLYKVRHRETGQLGVLKTLQPILAEDEEARAGLSGEEWLARRVHSHYFPEVLPLAMDRRHYLYYVMAYHEGATLQQRLERGQHFSPTDAVRLGIRLAKGLGALHRLDVIHRDVKPGNILLSDGGKLHILDLGVAYMPAAAGSEAPRAAGTPSFIPPEVFAGQPVTYQADLYAAGVTLYYLLTRKYPYGEIEPFQHPRFGAPVPPSRYRPDIPQWLENIMLKAVARGPAQRFETAEELLLALDAGETRSLVRPQRTPLMERNPLAVWQAIAVLSIVANLLLLYLVFVGA
jgi:serine/threonine protein phosphatase PrpC